MPASARAEELWRASEAHTWHLEQTECDQILIAIGAESNYGLAKDVLAMVQMGEHHGGVGLAGMRERVHEQGGRMDVVSDSSGTRILVRIPVVDVATGREMATPLSP